MSLLAKTPEGRAAELLAAYDPQPEFDWLRQPEIGSVMTRGRAGGTGAAFNLGEVTVTRCSVKLKSGAVGHGYVQGRRKDCAKAAALIDALMQTSAAPQVEEAILEPLRTEEATRVAVRAAKAAATRVEFFTMVRGED